LTLEEDEDVAPEEEEAPTRWPAWVRMLIYVATVLTVSVVLAFVGWECADEVLSLTAPDELVMVTVPENFTVEQVSEILVEQDMIEMPWLFELYCKFASAEDKIDPGTYELNRYYDYNALVSGMIAGSSSRATTTVTIPEGYEASQIFAMLEEYGVCSVEELTQTATNYDFDYDFLADIPLYSKNRLEGYLFPDTYEFYVEDEPVRVLEKFLTNFDSKFDDTMEVALINLNAQITEDMVAEGYSLSEIDESLMSVHDIVIVASLIEKETSSSSESATISSVIYNRLASDDYPLLQIDATVQYVLEERKEVLSSADLTIDSLYNTYRYPGLPAGPIANPGTLSIQAALAPEDTEYYFYALNSDGSHHFSETYFEHNQFLQEMEQSDES
ncbi:MAG: endolytic transglycosylase MltG, partial [Eubacteriales bacterium]